MKALRFIFPVLVSVGLAIAVLHLRGESRVLHAELELARMEREELDSLRLTQQRLQIQAPSDSTLTKLREEQAAIRRLRAELESLKKPSPTP